jgi:hypothetical protein
MENFLSESHKLKTVCVDIIILKINHKGRWGYNIENNKHKNSTTIMSITFLIIKYSLATNELLKHQKYFLSF